MKLARRFEEVAEKVSSQTGEIVTVVGLSAILLVLLVIAVSLTVVICRRSLNTFLSNIINFLLCRRIRKLKERQNGVSLRSIFFSFFIRVTVSL